MARTPKALALGAALRQAREEKKLLLRQLGKAIDRDIGVLSRWETGDRTPKPEQVAQVLTTLGVNGERYEEIMTLAYGTAESQWSATTLPEQRQQMTAYLDWEQNASRIVEVAPLLVPGLLQTSDYIKAIMTAGGVPTSEIATRVATRIGRRDVLTKRNPADILVLLGRGALNQEIGGRQVMIEQLRHLLEMAARPNVDLRIVPDHRGWHPGLEGAFTLIESSDAATGRRVLARSATIAFVETRRSILMLHEDRDVRAYRRSIEQIMPLVLSADASARLVDDLRKRMEETCDNRARVAEVEA
ncbi:helix-turn-helix domain-containing protein [Actinophytocola gossypii]|uniref:Helix-turn-helix transcriptional regulator n=1 Tax=Actinophytocola gossypii TaxID=2812003 RepID=A0ABT2JKG0_9PSEU|nr:Scr1 family TA system antitoxin-like transcriptional regulator [Actinophytocola gossypii]MCT2588243.1 helix-turn-helix transcriptional regulator [Actinophytocola gossypii]